MPPDKSGGIIKVSPPNTHAMYELFVELTDQLFYEGYAEQLAQTDPQALQTEFNDFLNAYSYEMV